MECNVGLPRPGHGTNDNLSTRHFGKDTPAKRLRDGQEAARLRWSDEEWIPSAGRASLRTRSMAAGPRIVVQRPLVRETPEGPTLATVTPMGLLIVFEARGAAVDMPSLRVQARKGIFSKSLTETLQPYIRGSRVEAEDVQVPEGRFLIQIAIADLQGRTTSESYRLEVTKP